VEMTIARLKGNIPWLAESVFRVVESHMVVLMEHITHLLEPQRQALME
jgi:hypothetical protein